MNNGFYSKLAVSNIKKNGQTYIPYLITCIFTVAMYYIMHSLSINEGLRTMRGGDAMMSILEFGRWVIGIFAVIFLFYTNSFLMKGRKKEIGLWNILGMEKRHILKEIGFETLYMTMISLAVGLLVGILFEKVVYLLLLKILKFEITLGFHIYGKAVLTTGILFAGIFLAIFLNSLRQVSLANPIELLRGGNVGEKEPKTKWVMVILGVLCLGGGYTLSIVTKNPLNAFTVLFEAVILVVAGTYFLFMAGSIAVLKLLRKNKKFYYQTKHFTAISGMLYRMKRNAVGLSNICILSTMVLVMLSTTISLLIGMKDTVQTVCPYDLYIDIEGQMDANAEVNEVINRCIADNQLTVKNQVEYQYLEYVGRQQENHILAATDAGGSSLSSEDMVYITFLTLSDYNEMSDKDISLKDGEIMIYADGEAYGYEQLNILGKEYQVTEEPGDFLPISMGFISVIKQYYIIVEDMEELQWIADKVTEEWGGTMMIATQYGYDLTGTNEAQIDTASQIQNQLSGMGLSAVVDGQAMAEKDFLGNYGGLFFLGIFLGILFIMATILIIYYKQISEGYEDQGRFEIMQKVGMSQIEVKQSIRSQILTVFFLPLITAGIHVGFAFPLISRLLQLLGLINVQLYIMCTVACFVVFAVMYGSIYSVTAKAYYKIVSQ